MCSPGAIDIGGPMNATFQRCDLPFMIPISSLSITKNFDCYCCCCFGSAGLMSTVSKSNWTGGCPVEAVCVDLVVVLVATSFCLVQIAYTVF